MNYEELKAENENEKRKFVKTPFGWCIWTIAWVLFGAVVTLYFIKQY